MNETLKLIHNRKSIRAFQEKPIDRETIDRIINAAMRSPTAGNLMLYSIIEVESQAMKEQLAKSCDDQPFIAKAPLVLLFLADYQRWMDAFTASGVDDYCAEAGVARRMPGEGDLFLACSDTLIAAQTAVIAAESLGIGSCYIGDIMENYESHRDLFNLPKYVFPISVVVFGYPKASAAARALTSRFPQKYIHFKNQYQRFDDAELLEMLAPRQPKHDVGGAKNAGQHFYTQKFSSDYNVEMTRSVKVALERWLKQED